MDHIGGAGESVCNRSLVKQVSLDELNLREALSQRLLQRVNLAGIVKATDSTTHAETASLKVHFGDPCAKEACDASDSYERFLALFDHLI